MPPPSQFLPQSTNQQQQYHSQQFLAASFGPKKRRLLLIYIHGFLGSATSFNEFPKHLHTLLTCLLSTSCPQYTVHTKIYPRFKTRHPIGEAAEMFSQWLSEFEDEDEETDVILLGHSMGGLLAGEVVLLPRLHPAGNDPRRYRHRILGLVGFDTPFLGMHPGVVTSGISSLFRPSPKPDKRKETTPMSPTTYEEEDLVIRKKPEHFDTGLPSRSDSGNRGIRNFLTKYSANIPGATVQYVMSHMEFAACLADPMGLSTRYRRLRGLEDGKDLLAAGGNGGIGGYRVRFVNYYTVCYGRDKEKEKEKEREEMAVAFANSTSTPPPLPPPHIIPVVPRTQGDQKPSLSQSPLQPEAPQDPLSILNARSQRYSLPEIPPPPKLKQKEKKERKERRERRERKFCLIPKEAKGGDRVGEEVGGDGEARDETWVKVPMGDVDEVGAHCGLFMAGAEIFETQRVMKSQEMRAVGDNSGGLVGVDTGNGRQSMDGPQALVMDDDERRELETKRRQYERLVGDLAERIEGWVKEHVGGLQAMEVAGQALKEGKNRSADQKC
ncbi:hypothetical protein EV426DRAFT_527279 [Tirmania nivea]|nr:hypothetical protein EV426DRAFT_527279 [Tirmania nivea]